MMNDRSHCYRWMRHIGGVLFFFSAEIASGCAVCGFGQDGSRFAFILTTGLLTFIPLIMAGGIIWYLRNQRNNHDTK